MSIEEITNTIRISDRIYSSGQPEEQQFKYIREAGFQAVINLAMANSENAIPEEGNIVTAHRMTYLHIPVPFEAPTIGHLRQFIKTMAAFGDQKVWVHCVVNYRASAFLYQYQRLVEGATKVQAKKVMFPRWQPNDVWQKFMSYTKEQIG